MTSTLDRPARAARTARLRRPRRLPAGGGTPDPDRTPAQDIVGTLPVAAVTAAVWAAAVGLLSVGVVVVLAWAVTGRGDDGIGTPLQASGVIWLVAHHAPVETGAGAVVGLLPLALLALPLTLLYRAGRWAARVTGTDTRPDAVLLVVAATAAYCGIAVLVSQASSIADASVPALAALGWSMLVAVLGLGAGVVVGAGLAGALKDRMPPLVRRSALVGLAAGAGLAVAAGLVSVAALVARWSTVTGLEHQVAPGVVDALELTAVSLAYLPNLVLWALSYLAGPGFAAGGGATIDPFSQSGALLPGIPLLGAIPLDAPPWAPLLLLLPVACGGIAAGVLRRRSDLALLDEVSAVLGGAVALGAVAGLLCAMSGGALGAGRLLDLGPHAGPTGLALAGLVAAGGALVSLVARVVPTIWVHDHVDLTDS